MAYPNVLASSDLIIKYSLSYKTDFTAKTLAENIGKFVAAFGVNRIFQDLGIVTIKKLCDGLEISLREFFDADIFDDIEQEIK